jgi:hypothetical protein
LSFLYELGTEHLEIATVNGMHMTSDGSIFRIAPNGEQRAADVVYLTNTWARDDAPPGVKLLLGLRSYPHFLIFVGIDIHSGEVLWVEDRKIDTPFTKQSNRGGKEVSSPATSGLIFFNGKSTNAETLKKNGELFIRYRI